MKAPAFSTNRGFMTETLSKPECEYVAEILRHHLAGLRRRVPTSVEPEDYQQEFRRTNAILAKLDLPQEES